MISFEDSKILVTGGTGFIGSYVVKRLVSLGAAVTIVDSSPASPPATSPDPVTFLNLNVSDPQFDEVVAQGAFEAIIHLAGTSYVPPSLKDPIGDLRNNAEVTLKVLEAIRHLAPSTRLIYASSAAVYGNPKKLPVSENHPRLPVSPYGMSKLAAEGYVSLYARLYGLRTANLRPFSVFGPGLRKQVVFDLLTKLYANRDELEVYGTGQEMRDFLYIDDVVSAALLVVKNGNLCGESYNVASGEGTSIHNLVEIILSATGMNPKVRYTGRIRPGDVLRWRADISQLASLGFTPSVSLREGIKQVVEWYDQIR